MNLPADLLVVVILSVSMFVLAAIIYVYWWVKELRDEAKNANKLAKELESERRKRREEESNSRNYYSRWKTIEKENKELKQKNEKLEKENEKVLQVVRLEGELRKAEEKIKKMEKENHWLNEKESELKRKNRILSEGKFKTDKKLEELEKKLKKSEKNNRIQAEKLRELESIIDFERRYKDEAARAQAMRTLKIGALMSKYEEVKKKRDEDLRKARGDQTKIDFIKEQYGELLDDLRRAAEWEKC